MRVLLDEHLNWRLARSFGPDYDVRSVRGVGWTGTRNGNLLRAAEDEFDALVTMDRGMEHQQRLSDFDLAVVLLLARSNRLRDTEGLVPDVERVLSAARPGRLYVVGGPKGRGGVD